MRLLLDIFLQTLRTLWAHKLRSFLTMFGIAWGVGSLLLLVGVGEGFRSGQRRQLNNIGENIMFIFSGQVPAVPGSQISARPYQLDYGDYLAIRDNAKAVRYISPVLSREDIRAVSEYTSTNGQVFGIVPEYNKIRTINMGPGRWINQEDETQHRRVVVIGSEMGRNLHPGRPAVGNSMTLNEVHFEVIEWFLGGLGLVTVGPGVIVIINILLVSVTERTKEIGLRKALGATNRNVLTQFFLEGAFLTLLSGGAGLAVAAMFMSLLSHVPQPEGFDTPQLVPTSAALAIISLAVSGIVAGLYPARRAAMMTPVEALR